jgi:amidase
VRQRIISVPEVAESYLARIAQTTELNALAWFEPEAVRRQAAQAQARLDRGELAGPLQGVPFTVKDVIATAEVPTTAGSVALRDNIPKTDASAVSRLRRAGGILLGKSNCPEFAFAITTDSPLHGRTMSPWGPHLSPGGSSGGESALLAAGASALGLGTDFGGSLRWPAQCTGVSALRPTPGRVPATGQLPGLGGNVGQDGDVLPNPATLQGRLQVIGPIARTVQDLELALSVISGEDGLDPLCVPSPLSGSDAVQLTDLPIAWCVGDLATPCSASVAAAVEAVVATLRGEGLRDVFVPDLLAGAPARYNRLRALDTLAEIRLAVRGREHLLSAELGALLDRPRTVAAEELSAAWRDALSWRSWLLARMRELPVLIAPVAPGPATGHEGVLELEGGAVGGWELMAYCRAVALAGVPAVSVPCGTAANGLPLSVQVIGRPFCEHEALAVARRVELLLGGARLPPRE